MDVGRSILFIFEDKSWIKKILVFAALFFLPLAGWLINGGYLLRLVANVINGKPHPLPEWNNWRGDFVGGLKVLVVGLIWSIPSLPFRGVSFLADSSLISMLFRIAAVALTAIAISALCDLATTGTIAGALTRRVIDRVIQNPLPWAIVIVVSFVLDLLSRIGPVGFIIGVLWTLTFSLIIQTHLAGQAYRVSEFGDSIDTSRL
jgi:hypothetical protein